MASRPDIGVDEKPDPAVAEVVEAARASHFARALDLANAALLRGVRHPALFNVRAMWFEQQGRYREALADFEAARAHSPRNPLLLDKIGNCLMRLSRWQQAIAAFDSAIAAAPHMARAHYGKGNALGILGNDEAMQQEHERAIALRPDYADALGSLAMIAFMRQGKITEAKTYAAQALAANPRQHTAIIALAMADIADGDVAVAETRLRSVLEDPEFGSDIRANRSLGVLADALDRLDRIAAAFAAYTTLNKKRRALYAARFETVRDGRYTERLTDYMERSKPWTLPGSERAAGSRRDAPVGHVFLLGFPRTGTTLLETVLASNPRVAALDENDCLVRASQNFLVNDDGLDRLAALGPDELVHWQEAYWKTVQQDRGISVAGKVFVDKSPFRSLQLPLIPRLFPEAKILFAIRDPRDVVLSCFRHRFEMSPANFEFLLLDDCARFYAAVMKLVGLCREKLPLNLRVHRYEDLVAGFDSSVRGICAFIGIDWSDSMRNFKDAADTTINSVGISAPQVRRGLYRSGVGQWRRYREQLAPVLPILQPWIERFGYPSE